VNVLKPHQKSTVETLLKNGISQREIGRNTGVDRKTIRKLAQALVAPAVGGPANSPMATGAPGQAAEIPAPPRPPGLASEASPNSLAEPARSACEPHRAWIEAQVRLGRNAMAIYQELVDRFGFASRYNSVKRFCRGLRSEAPEQFDRLEFLPGEEVQVDYGEGAPTLHPTSGRYRKPRLFVMTLRYSRRSYRQVVWKSGAEVWARLHEQAFRYFGGCCQYVVLDNLKEGVITPDLYEPQINRVYGAMLAHYGVVADPARVGDPNRKGTVENAIQHTQATALKGRRFDSIEAQNAHLADWEEKWAAQRIHGRAKRQVEEMFQAERAHLKPLPVEAFRYFEEGSRTVQDDTTIQVKGAWYAARPAPIGSVVLIRLYAHELEIRNLRTLDLIRRHPLGAKGELRLPDAERVFNPSRQTHQILARAEKIGPKILELCRALFEQRGREVQKSLWGIVGLHPRYPACILEQAATVALASNTRSYKGLRALADQLLDRAIAALDGRQGELPLAPVSTGLTQQHELIRRSADYAEFFARSVRSQQAGATEPDESPQASPERPPQLPGGPAPSPPHSP
jgi:transposase